ncbi:MAG: PhzF family phenazine biosynthesis protein [Verrucomicrobiota bacterium]|nr:PhzF family phenazine biosynthesis protein [Verrucomicrobiota bacterium]
MPNEYKFFTADVFTDKMFGGNQLAVLPWAQGLDDQTMQRIAREFNLSETVFVFPPQTASGTRRVRIFTPGSELPFAGHPTVGAAFVLAAIGEVKLTGDETRILFEEGVGPVPVLIRGKNGLPIFSQLSAAKMPELGPPPPEIEKLAAVLSLEPEQLQTTRQPSAFSCGMRYLFVTVRDLAALAQARVRIDEWERHVAQYWAPEIFVLTEAADDADVRGRMFAPGAGITEDAATGSAAAALAGYLAPLDSKNGMLRWKLRQGVEMGRPSTLEVEADIDGRKIVAVRVGGASVLVSEGVLRI